MEGAVAPAGPPDSPRSGPLPGGPTPRLKHWPQAQPTFERAPGLFHALKLLVPQGGVGRGKTIVVAMDHKRPVETCFRPLLRGVKSQQPSCGQP